MLINLINNSVKAMPDGGELAIRAWKEEDGVALSVVDTGVGMTPEKLHKVLGEGGTGGLGLSIVRRLLAQNGGELSMDSTPGSGDPGTDPLSPQRRYGMNTKVLVVDDEFLIRMSLESGLSDLGHQVKTAGDLSGKGLDLAESFRPDVVLLDNKRGGQSWAWTTSRISKAG